MPTLSWAVAHAARPAVEPSAVTEGVLVADGVSAADGLLPAAGVLPGAGLLPQAARTSPQATMAALTANDFMTTPSGTSGASRTDARTASSPPGAACRTWN